MPDALEKRDCVNTKPFNRMNHCQGQSGVKALIADGGNTVM
jgi:hypothetical protein